MTTPHLSKDLATFACELKISDIPQEVIARTEDLLVDWFGSAIAGKGSRPVETITQFAQNMGGFNATNPGSAEILINRNNSALSWLRLPMQPPHMLQNRMTFIMALYFIRLP